MKKAFELLLADPNVKSIFINIFGGIMRCDYIAEGVIKATKELELKIPLVVRLKGTKEAEAKQSVPFPRTILLRPNKNAMQNDQGLRPEDQRFRRP